MRLLLAAIAGLLIAAPAASASSLYDGPGPAPGPSILYAPPAVAPQLQNAPRSVWHAQPILVSGADAYLRGEYLYQDYLYDDHGAHEQVDPQDPRLPGNAFSQPNGTYTYPTAPAYANNAADLVEFRVRPLARSTAFRVTLNTLKDPSLVAFSIALGGQAGVLRSFPDGANVRAPADLFLTVHAGPGGGLVGKLVDAATGKAIYGPAPRVSVDPQRRQIEVRVAHASWNPGTHTVRMAMGVGLWDKANHAYLLPGPNASATQPGGSGGAQNPPAFFNVAFRTQEPWPEPRGATFVPDAARSPAWWRDALQGQALAAGDLSPIHADVDFAKLARGTRDESGVPRTGPIDRILASHFEPHQGLDNSKSCTSGDGSCEYGGQLQPYALYVPAKEPAGGYGMTLLLHALFTNYNLFEGALNQSELGNRNGGSLVLTPESRGTDGNYTSLAGVDVFEAWADVARHYTLDPAWSTVTGYSMGGIGTFKLAEQFPDLFAAAQSTSGDDGNGLEASLRNVPVLMWNMAVDEEVTFPGVQKTYSALDGLGYRYAIDLFAPGEHNTFYLNDQYGPAASWLGGQRVHPDPAHVTFAFDPTLDFAKYGFVADHAYWVSGLRARTAGAQGSIDAVSHGLGASDPAPSGTQHGAGKLTGGTIPVLAYASQSQTWGPVPAAPAADRLDISATNVSSATIDVARAHVDCGVDLHVTSDGPLTLTLAGCGRTVSIAGTPSGGGSTTGLPSPPATPALP
jgi:C-terminal binding-module, SLH-like, of glucodextranase